MINGLSAACPQESAETKWKQIESGRQSAAAVFPYLSRVWGVWAILIMALEPKGRSTRLPSDQVPRRN
jgi:hypothetical protein